MENKIGINIVIEREIQDNREVFIASSPDVNVLAEGKNIDEAKAKFIDGVKVHLKTFPEEKKMLIEDRERFEMPMLTRVFL